MYFRQTIVVKQNYIGDFNATVDSEMIRGIKNRINGNNKQKWKTIEISVCSK
jgi:hypothetical protein